MYRKKSPRKCPHPQGRKLAVATVDEGRIRTGAHQDAFVFFRRTSFECQEDVADQCREHHQSQERQSKGAR